MSRCLNKVTNIITQYLLPDWIVFPITENERNKIKQDFYKMFNLSRCLGAINCMYIGILQLLHP
jgi:hypothetical protein